MAAIGLLWAAIYLPGLGLPELKGEEGRRILPGLEMIESGEWIVPTMEGRPYLRKPPLINWAIAASVKLTASRAEWAVRLPSTLAVLALAFTAMVCGRELIAGDGARQQEKVRAGLLLGIVTLVNVGLIEKGRLAEIEALYVALTGIAIGFWLLLWRKQASPWLTYTLPWVALGLGLLCKGPPHLVFFYGIVGSVLWKSRRLRELCHPAHFMGLITMAGLFGWWAWLCQRRARILDPEQEAGRTWIEQLTHRLGFQQFDFLGWITSPFEALLMLFPWIIPLAAFWPRLGSLARRLGERDAAIVLGLRTGVLASGVLILLVPESRARFVQPLTLPAMLLAALILWHELPALWHRTWTRLAVGLMAVLSLIGIALPVLLWQSMPSSSDALVSAVLTLGAAVALWRIWIRVRHVAQPLRLALATAFAACLLSALAAATLFPASRRHDNMRPVGTAISREVAPSLLAIFNPGRHPAPLHWRYYLTVPHVVVQKLSAVPAAAQFLCIDESDLHKTTETRVREQLGFSRTVSLVIDNEGRRFLLMTRPGETSSDSAIPTVRLPPSQR